MDDTGYTYKVEWSVEDAEYVGKCLEFPSLSWLSPKQDDALSGIRALVRECIIDMIKIGEAPIAATNTATGLPSCS